MSERTDKLRAKRDELIERMVAFEPDAAHALTAVALGAMLEDLEDEDERVTVHPATLERWARVLRTLLGVIATHHDDDDTRGRPELERDVVIDNGHDTPSVITQRVFYDVSEGLLLELEDYLA